MKKLLVIFYLLSFIFYLSCSRPPQSPSTGVSARASTETPLPTENREAFIEDYWNAIFARAGLPDSLKEKIIANLLQGPDFLMELLNVLEADPYLYILVDKQHGLSQDYAPADLVELVDGNYRITRRGLMLRQAAVESLEVMAAAASSEGVILTAASAYRSFANQAEINSRLVSQMGQQEADRVSAPPGHSQHQLGLVLDFYPIEDRFATTPASAWLERNAGRFGWSLSYPDGFEEITGYLWESWHYRYLGPNLAAFKEKYFDGIQQYALQFIYAWLETE